MNLTTVDLARSAGGNPVSLREAVEQSQHTVHTWVVSERMPRKLSLDPILASHTP